MARARALLLAALAAALTLADAAPKRAALHGKLEKAVHHGFAPLPKGMTEADFHPHAAALAREAGAAAEAAELRFARAQANALGASFVETSSFVTARATNMRSTDRSQVDREPDSLSKVPETYTPVAEERFGATSIVRGDKIYVFGGVERGGALPTNNLIAFDIGTKAWTQVVTYGSKPPARLFHSASLSEDGKTMYITGGTPCFARIYQQSLQFDDANGQYNPLMQHATTVTLSAEHSQGLDDVYAFDFESAVWVQLKASAAAKFTDCKAVTNVYYNNPAVRVPVSVATLACALVACLLAFVAL